MAPDDQPIDVARRILSRAWVDVVEAVDAIEDPDEAFAVARTIRDLVRDELGRSATVLVAGQSRRIADARALSLAQLAEHTSVSKALAGQWKQLAEQAAGAAPTPGDDHG